MLTEKYAVVAQLVERVLGKDEVTSSSLVDSSKYAGVLEWHRGQSKKLYSGGSSPLTRTRGYIVSPKEQ